MVNINNKTLNHFIYFDNGVFRLLKRDIDFAKHFYAFFDQEYPELFKDIDIIFTWSQLLEDINLGNIISKIKISPLWKEHIAGKNIFKSNAINASLDKYFNIISPIVEQCSNLQKRQLLDAIDTSINIAHIQANVLLETTLLKVRTYIEKNDYIKELIYHIFWNFITSNDFIKSKLQWEERKDYFNSLIAVWYKLFLDGYQLDVYRLVERRYYSYTNFSKTGSDNLRDNPLKQESDLCDSELIHYVSLGLNQYPVIGITFDGKGLLEKRLSIMKQTLIDLRRDVEDWKVNPIPGKILSLERKKKTIISVHSICFNTPFEFSE